MSEESSFREMFEFPNESLVNRQRKYMLKSHRQKKTMHEQPHPQKQTFYDVVQKAKNVALFTQNLKNRIAQNRTLNVCTLKPNELDYLQNESQDEVKCAFFSHDNKLILGVEVFYIAVMFLYLWQCTFQIVFGEMPTNEIINGVTLLFYIVHILLFQVTEYKNERSELVTNVNLIRQIYMNQKIVKDSISVLVIMLQLTPIDNEETKPIFMILRVFSLLSYFELSSTCDKVESLFVSYMHSETINSLLKLMFKLFLFLHLLSMALNFMVTIENAFNVYDTWLNNENLSYSSPIEKYVIGWYWGSTILSTVGFGEIIPANNIERFVISIIEVCCCMTFGYFVNAIGEIIKMRSEASEKYQKELRKLNRYLNDITLSTDLKHKIRTHYFNKNLIEQQYDPNQEKQVLDTITPNLKNSLLEEINLKIIKKCNYLQKFRDQTTRSLAESLKRIILAPQTILYSRNTTDRKLWFIESGTVDEVTDNFEGSILRKPIYVYNDKDPLIGWINFLIPGSYKTMAKAQNFTIAHELTEREFLKCFESNLSEYHKFLQMKQRLLQKKKKFELKCISCGRYTHNAINCPRIHLVKKQGYKIALQKRQLDKFRESQNRKTERVQYRYNWKCLFGTKQLEKEAQVFNNDSTNINSGTIENYLKKLAFRESVNNFEKKRCSVCVIIPKDAKNEDKQQKILPKNIENIDRSMISFDSEDVEKGIEFEKAFYNREFKSYMPQNDIEEILVEYSRKILKKKMKQSTKDLSMPYKR